METLVRYFCEMLGEKVVEVIVQDSTGVHTFAGVVLIPRINARSTLIDVANDAKVRRVSTTSREYLEYIRLWERSSYMASNPTEIREDFGSLEDVSLAVWVRGW